MLGFLGTGITLSLLDLSIKNEIEKTEAGKLPQPEGKLAGRIRIYKHHNKGFSFGFLKDRPKVVEMVPLCLLSAAVGAFAWIMRKPGDLIRKAGFTLVIAGGASNLYDRLKRGYVVDYFSIQWKKLERIVLNLGDVYIFVGAGLMVLAEFVNAMREQK